MNRLQLAVTPLRILLLLMFAALVVNQVAVLPGALDDLVDSNPELAGQQWLLLVAAELALCCVQVVIACIWKLLGLVTSDRIFSERSLVWVDVIVWSIVVAWALLLVTFGSLAANLDFTGLPSALLLLLLAGGVLGLLMVVMRALLRQATTLRVEMEAVI